VAPSLAPNLTSRPLPPCCWCFSDFDTAPAPKAERTLGNHDSVGETREETLLPCSAAHPTELFRSVLQLVTRSLVSLRGFLSRRPPSAPARAMRSEMPLSACAPVPCSRVDS